MARTATDRTSAASNGLNLSPAGTIITDLTRSADCSAYSPKPLDGSLVTYAGARQAVLEEPDPLSPKDFATVDSNGSALRMVWSETGRTDLQATAYKRVPVLIKGIEVRTKLYNFDSAAGSIQAGDLVFAASNVEAIGSNAAGTHFIPDICAKGSAGNDDAGWLIGVVVKGTDSPVSLASDGADGVEITIALYDVPVFLSPA